MGFVGPFIGRESQVAVDAVDALFGLKVFQPRVEWGDVIDEGLGEVGEVGQNGFPPCFVGAEPIAVVVIVEFAKKR